MPFPFLPFDPLLTGRWVVAEEEEGDPVISDFDVKEVGKLPSCVKISCMCFFQSRVLLFRPWIILVVELLVLANVGEVILVVLVVGIFFK